MHVLALMSVLPLNLMGVDLGLMVMGGLVVFLDFDRHDYHITARAGHDHGRLKRLLTGAERHGLVPFDGDEVPEEVLEDGSIRIHLKKQESDEIESRRLTLFGHSGHH